MHGPIPLIHLAAVAAVLTPILIVACGEPPTVSDPDSPSPPAEPEMGTSSSYVTFVGAGDIASCKSAYRDEATARLIRNISGTVFTLGDNAYPDGSSSNYSCYNSSWGTFKSRTRPSPGNHEYHVSGARPYFRYFGSRAGPSGRGYYSYNIGAWHIVSLNSEANLSAQASWLRNDLAANRRKCTLAYWHRPLFTSGRVHGPATKMRPIFKILYDARADVVLSGHNHQYERFAPQDPYGRANSSRGIRQFVVGTGGSGSLYGFSSTKPNSQRRWSGYGVLKLRLYSDRYTWQFVPIAGRSFTDSGSGTCH